MQQVLGDAQTFVDICAQYLDVVRWATLYRDAIVYLNNEHPDPQQSDFDELHGLAARNLAIAESLGIDPIGAAAFVQYASELSSVTLLSPSDCDAEWAAAVSRAVTAFLRSVARGQMHYGAGPFSVNAAGLQTLVLPHDGVSNVAAPALALEPQSAGQSGHMQPLIGRRSTQCESSLVDCQLPDGVTSHVALG